MLLVFTLKGQSVRWTNKWWFDPWYKSLDCCLKKKRKQPSTTITVIEDSWFAFTGTDERSILIKSLALFSAAILCFKAPSPLVHWHSSIDRNNLEQSQGHPPTIFPRQGQPNDAARLIFYRNYFSIDWRQSLLKLVFPSDQFLPGHSGFQLIAQVSSYCDEWTKLNLNH